MIPMILQQSHLHLIAADAFASAEKLRAMQDYNGSFDKLKILAATTPILGVTVLTVRPDLADGADHFTLTRRAIMGVLYLQGPDRDMSSTRRGSAPHR